MHDDHDDHDNHETSASEAAPTARVRARTISIKRLSKRELERGRMLFPATDHERPRSRGDCQHGPHADRPCPFVSCKHHLFIDVNDRTGSIKLNFPDLEVWDLRETCALDIADRGGITLEEVGEIMNLTRERIRQLETRGLAKLKALGSMSALEDYLDTSTPPSPSVQRIRAHVPVRFAEVLYEPGSGQETVGVVVAPTEWQAATTEAKAKVSGG
jgi:hypothetical protein